MFWTRTRATRKQRPLGGRPTLECLEERCLLSAGDLDPSFGTGGMVLSDVSAFGLIHAVAVQDDGMVLVAGERSPASGMRDVALARYATNGQLDPTFGSAGKVFANF